MKKYLVLLKLELSSIASFRFQLFFRLFIRIFQFIVLVTLWSLTTGDDPAANKQLIIYYMLFVSVESAYSFVIARTIGRSVKYGRTTRALAKPIHFLSIDISRGLASIVVRIISPAATVMILATLFPAELGPASAGSAVLFVAMFLLGLIVWNFFTSLIGSIAFWTTEIDGLTTVLDLTFLFLMGKFIPAFYFPEALQNLIRYTPLPYLAATPINVYQGEADSATVLLGIVVMIAWTVGLALVNRIIYTKALKKYEAYG